MHNLFPENKPEYCLLKALRCHVEVDLYASLTVHTDQTIMVGKEKVARFYELMKVGPVDFQPCTPDLCLQEYMALEELDLDDDEEMKSWDFPKMHSQLHLFDDIVAEGVTRNYNVIAVYLRTYFSPFLSNFKTFFLSFHMLTTHEHKTRHKKTSYWYKETSIDYIVHKTDFLKTI